jgi:hypothetical protein
MAKTKALPSKKYFTPDLANRTLPLVRAIVQDVVRLAGDLRDRHERLSRLKPAGRAALGEAHQEELRQVVEEFERDQERMREYERELKQLGAELKDYDTGLVDFPCWMNGREVCLCWRLGEPAVGHWHELDAGFAGRRKLAPEAGKV